MSGFETFGLWFLSGLVCSIVWPLAYRKNMKGHWQGFLKMWPVFGLMGPLALVAAFPL